MGIKEGRVLENFAARRRFHIVFVVLLVILAAYLVPKTMPEESWDGWGKGYFGAQTMLTIEHWSKDGILNHKLLFLPIGYSKAVKYLDEPEMRHHARGIVTGELIGRRLYYTHFPPGYILPYAFLMKAGFSERHWFRLLSVCLSLTALALLYISINIIASPATAFVVSLYYGISTMFLDYADSIANHAVDEVLRFAILLASLIAIRSMPDKLGFKRYTVLIWLLYFVLAVSSYDSTLFIFIWLVSLDIIFRSSYRENFARAIAWRRWLFLGTAPVAGFVLQALQNMWYLGFENMILDFKGVFLVRSSISASEVTGGEGMSILSFLTDHSFSVFRALDSITGGVPVMVIVLLTGAVIYLKRATSTRLPSFAFVVAFLVAGIAFPFVFDNTTNFEYEGRQLAPFAGLLIGSATVLLISSLRNLRRVLRCGRGKIHSAVLIMVLLPALFYIWSVQAYRTVEYVGDWPNNDEDVEWVEVMRTIASMTTADTVIFRLVQRGKGDYPQPNPMTEFYTNATVLHFKRQADIKRDWLWLKWRSEEPFDTLFVTENLSAIKSLAGDLKLVGKIEALGGLYILKVPANVRPSLKSP